MEQKSARSDERKSVTEPIAPIAGHFLRQDISAPGAESMTSEVFSQRRASSGEADMTRILSESWHSQHFQEVTCWTASAIRAATDNTSVLFARGTATIDLQLMDSIKLMLCSGSSPPARRSVRTPITGFPALKAYPHSHAVPESTSDPSRMATITSALWMLSMLSLNRSRASNGRAPDSIGSEALCGRITSNKCVRNA